MAEKAKKRPILGDTREVLQPMPGSKHGIWRIETFRKCLNCEQGFWSKGPENQLCEHCKKALSPIVKAIDRGMVALYEHPEDAEVENNEYENVPSKTISQLTREADLNPHLSRVKCPVCKAVLVRGTQSTAHKCFQRDQRELRFFEEQTKENYRS